MPPRIIRRLVLAPIVFALCVLLLIGAPLLLLAAAIADLFLPGNWRTLRLMGFVTSYLLLEVAAFIALFFLWMACGFGIWIRAPSAQAAHYRFMRWWLHTMNRAARIFFKLRIHIEERPQPRPGPILVFSRHAGPGNSMLLVGTILVGYRRRPRIVMLAKLQWEPLYDIMLNRLPNRFIKHDKKRSDQYVDAIGQLARDLGDMDAFVLFPEGRDFTERLRTRAIEYLKRKGFHRAAARAEQMKHVLPPRHRGVMAAIQNAPAADVVFVAHSVLEDVGTIKQLWSRIPFEQPIVGRYWRIPPTEVPRDSDELIEWLYGWWERIDGWIAERAIS